MRIWQNQMTYKSHWNVLLIELICCLINDRFVLMDANSLQWIAVILLKTQIIGRLEQWPYKCAYIRKAQCRSLLVAICRKFVSTETLTQVFCLRRETQAQCGVRKTTASSPVRYWWSWNCAHNASRSHVSLHQLKDNSF